MKHVSRKWEPVLGNMLENNQIKVLPSFDLMPH